MIEKTKFFSNFFEKGVDKWKLASYNDFNIRNTKHHII